jgi:hypothetical protein
MLPPVHSVCQLAIARYVKNPVFSFLFKLAMYVDCDIHVIFIVHGGVRDFRFGANPAEHELLAKLV